MSFKLKLISTSFGLAGDLSSKTVRFFDMQRPRPHLLPSSAIASFITPSFLPNLITRTHRKPALVCTSAAADVTPEQVVPVAASPVPVKHRRTRKRSKQTRPPARPGAVSISKVSIGDTFIGTVCEVGPADSAWIEIGVATPGGRSVRARLRLPVKNGKPQLSETVGGILPVTVLRISPASARIEVSKGVSLPQATPTEPPADARSLESVKVCDPLQGRVVAVGSYGAVVDIGLYRIAKQGRRVSCKGLLPRRHFHPEWACVSDLVRRADATRLIDVGDEIFVWARVVRPANGFLLLDGQEVDLEQVGAVRRARAERKKRLKHRKPPSSMTVGTIRFGYVVSSMLFGLFVDIGTTRDALLHSSEMGKYYTTWKENLTKGVEVLVEIIKVEEDKVSLKLLEVKDDVLAEAFERASRASATVADVKRAEALQAAAQNRTRKSRKVEEARDKGGGDGETPDVVQANSESVDTSVLEKDEVNNIEDIEEVEDELKEGDTDDGDDEDEEEKDEDVDDMFSDEYFEDKYGL